MSEYRYEVRAAFVTGDDERRLSVTADEILLPDEREPKKTGLVDQHGNPIYRVRAAVPFGFVGRSRE